MPSFKDRLSSIPATVRMSRRGYVEVPNTPDSSQHEGQVNDKAAQRGVEAETHRMSTAGMLVTILGVCIVLVAVWILATATSKESGVEAEFIAFPLPKCKHLHPPTQRLNPEAEERAVEAARQKVFQPDYRYWNMSSSDSQRAWDVLGRELVVYIPSSDLDRYGLARGLELADGYDAYPLAVSHQLHCLVSRSTLRMTESYMYPL